MTGNPTLGDYVNLDSGGAIVLTTPPSSDMIETWNALLIIEFTDSTVVVEPIPFQVEI